MQLVTTLAKFHNHSEASSCKLLESIKLPSTHAPPPKWDTWKFHLPFHQMLANVQYWLSKNWKFPLADLHFIRQKVRFAKRKTHWNDKSESKFNIIFPFLVARVWKSFSTDDDKISNSNWIIFSKSIFWFTNLISLDLFPFTVRAFIQVSTSTGVMSHYASLQVVVPEAFILGSGELHVDMGSALNLVCIIEKVIWVYWCAHVDRNDNEATIVHSSPSGRVQRHLSTYIGSEIITW